MGDTANVAIITAIGFLSVFCGSMAGYFIAGVSRRLGRRFEGAATGFTAGLLIAFVCFKILAEGFMAASLYWGVVGVLAGVAAAMWLEGLDLRPPFGEWSASRGANAAFAAAMGVMLHHFPEGLALGGMCVLSPRQGLVLAALIAAHCIPEAAAVFMPLGGGKNVLRPIVYAIALSAPMALGCLLGAGLTGVSGVFTGLSLTFSGGVMLYITCGEMLPGSRRLLNGRLTTAFAGVGFVLGVVITA